MRIYLLLLAVFAALGFGSTSTPPKPYIISYPDDTDASVIHQARKAIEDAGGVIEHEYTLIKALAVKASKTMLEPVQAMGTEHNVLIEEDQTISIADSS
ncbi:inhibitor propeptide protein [Teratosphaeria destructans]|uniref:Inhibitor propeptide protein n=1 Tax=Teratosphaeria destructans TaxID=418781 RepID=A0A9W7SPK9_9PEZI|nr:inhibitor propeptide protein [Teratosphaeria destructans]